jgi:hypothetical protein
MANPNMANAVFIIGNTSSFLISSNANPFATALVNNPAASDKIYKINTIIATNVNGSNNYEISIKLFTQDDLGGSNTDIVSTVTVPADGSVVVVNRENPIYLLEDKSIGAFANTGNTITVTCSWEEIS